MKTLLVDYRYNFVQISRYQCRQCRQCSQNVHVHKDVDSSIKKKLDVSSEGLETLKSILWIHGGVSGGEKIYIFMYSFAQVIQPF